MSIKSMKRLIESNPSQATNLKTETAYTDALIVNELNRIKSENMFNSNIWGTQKQFEENNLSTKDVQFFEIKLELNRTLKLYNIDQFNVEQHIAEYDTMKAKQRAEREAKQQAQKVSKRSEELNALRDENERLKKENETLKQSNNTFLFVLNQLNEKGVA